MMRDVMEAAERPAAHHTLIPQGCACPLPSPPRVVGMGGVGVDYLAAVAAFPQPDDKLRTEALEVQARREGGSNGARIWVR